MKYPVVELNGFKYWKKPRGFARAYSEGGRRYYADDYPVSEGESEPEDFTEPDDFEFIRLMNGQEK